MNNLIIDTSTKYLYICLVDEKSIIAEKKIEGFHNHGALSVSAIDKILTESGLTCDDLSGIYCGYGPGSYTGERISVTIGKMIASLKNIPLYEVSSLFLACSGYDEENVAVMFDARRGNSFCACYGNHLISDKLRPTNEFMEEVNKLANCVVVTEDNFKVNPFKVIKKAERVVLVDAFVPNYLRVSEAEYNLEHKND